MSRKKFLVAVFSGLALVLLWVIHRVRARYAVSDVMDIPVREFTNFQYPEDPAARSVHYGQYAERRLKLITRDGLHFDFIFEPEDSRTARIAFRDVDARLMTPSLPSWTKNDAALERIALTDREWNRQQVSFDPRGSHIQISGGNGFEKKNLYSAALAKNCLNAGLWEVLLFDEENGRKALYYHGWFTFPLGHYKRIFERGTGLSYWRHWYYLEHWESPAGLKLDLGKLRNVTREIPVKADFNPDEPILMEGEQINKRRNINAGNLFTWGDFIRESPSIRFAAFLAPGRYDVNHPWKNEYWRLAKLQGAVLRDIRSPAASRSLQEIELRFESAKGEKSRFIVGGFSLSGLPRLKPEEYPRGLYMPMGIGVPPFFQSYADLEKNPPDKSPYFCLWLDSRNRWINHHEAAVDGPVLFLDKGNPRLLHVYLLSYERHALVGHYRISIPAEP